MARNRKPAGGSVNNEWMNTYADMVTLLFAFFVLLYSMSSLDATKFNMLVKAIQSSNVSMDPIVIFKDPKNQTGEASGGNINIDDLDGDSLAQIYARLTEYTQEQGMENTIELSQGEGYVFISFSDNILFEPNSAHLRPETMEILNFIGYGIKSIEDEAGVICINGHTALIPDDPNYPVSDRLLSAARANAVLMHFEDEIKIDPAKLILMAFGKNYPITDADNNTEAGRARNRRVEILIQSENAIGANLETVYERLAG